MTQPRRRFISRPLRRVASLGAVATFATLVSACAPPYVTPEYLEDATETASVPAPEDWTAFPGSSGPVFGSIGPVPDGALALQVEITTDGGESWSDAFGSPINIEEGFYSTTLHQEGDLALTELPAELRARWAFKGPKVTAWSELRTVLDERSVPAACLDAMSAAHALDMSLPRDSYLSDAVRSCENLEQFLTALYLYPGAMDLNYAQLEWIDPREYTSTACMFNSAARACQYPNDFGVYDETVGLYRH